MKNIFMAAFLLVTSCSVRDQQSEPAAEPEENVEILADNLDIPWSIQKTNDTFYVTERTGAIVKVEEGEVERQKIELTEELSDAPEAGLLGLALAPDFSDSNEAFVYYTYEGTDGQFNRLAVLTLEEENWQEERVLLDRIPSGRVHHGGRIKIGLDEKLYVTAGDAAEPESAQDLDSLAGKILRVNLDGTVPEDNPYPDSYVFSYGHRNPQGLAWSEDGETLYTSEHGEQANDEINVIEAGQNYGWPVIEGEEEQEGMVPPLFTSGPNETWAPSGMDYYDGKLYTGALRGSAILRFDLETNEQQEFLSGFGRIRDVFIEQDVLYFITNNTDGRGDPSEQDDKLYRVLLEEEE